MKAKRLLFVAKGKCEVEEFQIGERPGPGELLVENICSMVSPGTEMNLFLGLHSGFSDPSNKWAKYPMEPGYNSCGRVLAAGEGAEGFKPGDMVFGLYPHASHLLKGAGGFVKVPAGLDPESACYAKLMAISMNGARVASPKLGEAVGVFGQGLIGLFALAFAKMSGAYPLIAFDICDERLDISRRMGADASVNPLREAPADAVKRLCFKGELDCAIEASGFSAVIPDCVKLLGLGGRVVLLGSPHKDVSMNFYREVHCKQISVIGAHENGAAKHEEHRFPWTMRRNMELALKLAAEGRISLRGLTTHRASFAEAQSLYERIGAREKGMLGCLIQWQGDAAKAVKAGEVQEQLAV